MKTKIIFILIPLLFLSGCKIKEYTPELPVSFNQTAVVSSGDFSFECEICADMPNNVVSVRVLSTEAQGLVYSFNGSELSFSFDGFDYTVNGLDFEGNNTAIIIYQLCSSLMKSESPSVSRMEKGFKYQGTIPFGDFVMIQNEDSSLKSLSFRHSDYKIKFTS